MLTTLLKIGLLSALNRQGGLTVAVGGLLAGLMLCAGGARAQTGAVADLYGRAEFGAAREMLQKTAPEGDSEQRRAALLWQLRLSSDPEEALALCAELLADDQLSASTRLQVQIQAASLDFARGDHRDVLTQLLAVVDQNDPVPPGDVFILTGLSYWAVGQPRRAREMFASVRVDDPAFVWARYYLGMIGLAGDDLSLALRYFESAERNPLAQRTPALLAGQWLALQRSEEIQAAALIAAQLDREHHLSLAAVTVRNELRLRDQDQAEYSQRADTLQAVGTSAPGGLTGETGTGLAASTSPAKSAGRVTLQLAAFSDRSLALCYVDRWFEELPELRIDRSDDPRGQLLYKVRLGNFMSRAQAQTEARRLRQLYGFDALIVDTSS
jgi:hypothetical protein